jgi:integrase
VWAKKIRGKLHYFGPWEDPAGALARYEAEKEALHSGITPRPDPEAVTVKDVANAFLNHKQALVKAGELAPVTFEKYLDAVTELLAQVGKGRLAADLGPDDFAAVRARMSAKWGPYRLGDCVQHIRSAFKYAYEVGLLDRPARFGPGFKGPSRKTVRLHRAAQGPKLFTAEEVRRLIDAANQPVKAMLLLGINCGFGNADCGKLPVSALDLDGGWLDYPRPKTGTPRRCPLWPETVAAIREALAARPKPRAATHAALAFLTHSGRGWDSDSPGGALSRETRRLMQALGIGRPGLNFYALRHTFRTVADGVKDQPAADLIMGHEVAHMSSVYREGIDDERLRAVADHVRAWLYPPEKSAKDDGSTPADAEDGAEAAGE